MAPPINPAATPAATPRCAWAGAGTATAVTAKVETARSAINVFFMASTFLIETRDSGKAVCQRQKFHISRLISMNGFARFDDESGRRDRHWRLALEKDFTMNGTAGF